MPAELTFSQVSIAAALRLACRRNSLASSARPCSSHATDPSPSPTRISGQPIPVERFRFAGPAQFAVRFRQCAQTETGNVIIPATITPDPAPGVENAPVAASLVTPAPTAVTTVKALRFGSRPLSVSQPLRRREAPPIDIQFPLF